MKLKVYDTISLVPIGNLHFTFGRRTIKKPLRVQEVDIKNQSDIFVDESDFTELLALMKQKDTDLLTDGTRFYTTRCGRITEIAHPSFEAILKATPKDEILQLLF